MGKKPGKRDESSARHAKDLREMAAAEREEKRLNKIIKEEKDANERLRRAIEEG